ncbi:MAG: hypothetical protein AB7O32_09090 [Vicinamibacterales bacterium]
MTAASLALAGGLAGVTTCYGLIDRPHAAVVSAAFLLGALLARALRDAVNPSR